MTTVPAATVRAKRNLGHIRVQDVMHQGIISVQPETPIAAVAEIMASQRVHAVALRTAADPKAPWNIVSALDVVSGTIADVEPHAGQIAATEVVTISADERLDHAAQMMAEHALSHLIVIDPASGHPNGVLSTLDVVGAVAG